MFGAYKKAYSMHDLSVFFYKEIFEYYKNRSSGTVIDLCGLNHPGISKFKEQFSPDLKEYYILRYYKPSLKGLLLSLRDRLLYNG
jgi:hypothetical protein